MPEPLIFQAIAWQAEDVEIQDHGATQSTHAYYIKIFGRDAAGKSVSVTVTGYRPEFYVKMPNNALMGEVRKIASKHAKSYLDFDMHLVQAKEFWGFTNDEAQDFAHVTCRSAKFFKTVSAELIRSPLKFGVYESNIEPYLKFIHERGIQPCGWIKINRYAVGTEILESHSQIDVECTFKSLRPFACDDTAPFIVAAFDIECTSSGGEFPVPVKTYRHMASQIYDLWNTLEKRGLTDYNKKTALIAAMEDAFDLRDKDEERPQDRLSRVVTKRGLKKAAVRERLALTIDDMVTAIQSKGAGQGAGKREVCVGNIVKALVRIGFPPLSGDPIIQIGTTFHKYGSRECFYKHVITLGTCEPIEGVEVVECKTEAEVLIEWRNLMRRMDPDILTGYNIFGFDFDYVFNRAAELGIQDKFMRLSRLQGRDSQYKEQKLSSSALGDNLLRYIQMEGRVLIDLMKVVQRDHKLDSYKLDNVAHHFLKMNKNDVSPQDIFALQKGSAADRARIAAYCVQDCALCNQLVMKLEIVANNMGMSNVCLVPMEFIFMRGQGIKIFSLVMRECNANGYRIPVSKKGMSVRRSDIDLYVPYSKTADKVEERIKAMCKAVRDVPEVERHRPFTMMAAMLGEACAGAGVEGVDYHALKGGAFQWLKEKDLLHAREDLQAALSAGPKGTGGEAGAEDEDGYEGAIVLEPKQGIYTDQPVVVLDFASLYPSCMSSENLCPTKAVLEPKYDNLPGVKYLDIEYDLYDDKKTKVGVRKCRFVDGERGVIPRILMKLLAARKATRKRMTLMSGPDGLTGYFNKDKGLFTPEDKELAPFACAEDEVEPLFNEFQVAVLDGLQNAYKVTANSLYGQFGAKTSPIYFKDIAACTTATGRKMIMMAKEFLETRYGADVVYGDTDSVFATFPAIPGSGHAKIAPSIKMAMEASEEFRKLIKAPHDLEYEKTFWPFILLSKKRYVGNLYEFDDRKYKQKSMGIVLRRRDNAQVVKDVYGGVLDIILGKQDVAGSVRFLQEQLDLLVSGKLSLDKLVITKSLRGEYKDPTRIAHKVLADRIAERDPGNKPQSNDRIPYVYVVTAAPAAKGEKVLQGEKIETPAYIKEHGLVPDYAFYITNQIMKPVIQLYGLVAEQLPGYCQPPGTFERVRADMMRDLDGDANKVKDKMETLREMIAKEILFDPVISRVNNALVRQSMVAKKYGGAAPALEVEPPAKKPRAARKSPAPEKPPRKPRKAKVESDDDF